MIIMVVSGIKSLKKVPRDRVRNTVETTNFISSIREKRTLRGLPSGQRRGIQGYVEALNSTKNSQKIYDESIIDFDKYKEEFAEWIRKELLCRLTCT